MRGAYIRMTPPPADFLPLTSHWAGSHRADGLGGADPWRATAGFDAGRFYAPNGTSAGSDPHFNGAQGNHLKEKCCVHT